MTPQDFQYLAALLRRVSGLVLTEDKTYLVESRLMPLVRKHGLGDLSALIHAIRAAQGTGALVDEVADAMTTNESFFFRDIKPFTQFRELVLPTLLEARAASRRIRIWCAGCSSGQEPYSLAIILREEAAKLMGWRVEILGTDISGEMLEKAKAGLYSQFEVQRGLPVQLLIKYFNQIGDKWRIDPSLRELVGFRQFNLLHDASQLGVFDVVFCRNVLIYFDQDTKRQVLDRIATIMSDDGFLYLGGAETVLGISDKFRPVPGQRGVYTLMTQSYGDRQAAQAAS